MNMKLTCVKLSFSSILIMVILMGVKGLNYEIKDSKHVVIAYVMGSRDVKVTANDAMKLTHINYAFADVVDGKVIEISDKDAEHMSELNNLKVHNPKLKILISIGGWSRSKGFSDAVLTPSSREIFASSCVEFMLKHKLDGVDLDWEYPAQIGDGNQFRPQDKYNFTKALALIRSKLDQEDKKRSKHFLLTIATGANQKYLDNVEMKQIIKYLDFVNIMTYDFHGSYNKITGHHTNLFESETDTDKRKRSTAGAVEEHLKAGVPKNKLVVGAAFYGKGWTKVKGAKNGLHQEALDGGFTIPYKVIKDSLASGSFTRYWDEEAKAPYAWSPKNKVFIGYDDAESVDAKCKYIIQKGLLGIMYWEYSGDDDGKLLEVMHKNLSK